MSQASPAPLVKNKKGAVKIKKLFCLYGILIILAYSKEISAWQITTVVFYVAFDIDFSQKTSPTNFSTSLLGLFYFSLFFEKKETPANCTGGLEKFVCLKSKLFNLTEI